MPFAAAFLVLCCALFYFSVNTGQIAVEKTRVVNASDAAAYSAGIVQARALNLTAYTNRAIVANQVAVAQMLTLVNELNHLTSFYTATDASVIDVLGEGIAWATRPPSSDVEQTERYDQHAVITAGSLIAQFYGYSPAQFIDYVVPYVNAIGSGVITAANAASVAMEGQMQLLWAPGELTLNDRAMDAGRAAASAMDPTIRVEYSPASALTSAAPSIVRRYSGDDRTRAQDVVMRALDRNIINRDENAYSAVLRLGSIRTGLERRGRTHMPDLDTWRADDTQDYRAWAPSFPFRPRRTRTTRIEGASAQIGGGEGSEPRATYLSYVYNEEDVGEYFWAQYNGMASLYDIADGSDEGARQNRPGFTVLARKRKQDTRTSGHAESISPTGRLALFSDVPEAAGSIASLSRAEIIYHRPPRADGATEYPNLFNPFWTVRLTTPTAVDRAYALVRNR